MLPERPIRLRPERVQQVLPLLLQWSDSTDPDCQPLAVLWLASLLGPAVWTEARLAQLADSVSSITFSSRLKSGGMTTRLPLDPPPLAWQLCCGQSRCQGKGLRASQHTHGSARHSALTKCVGMCVGCRGCPESWAWGLTPQCLPLSHAQIQSSLVYGQLPKRSHGFHPLRIMYLVRPNP